MQLIINNTYEEMSRWTAEHIANRINNFNPSKSRPFVLGLPTGSSPIGTYRELVKLHKEGKVSFDNVVTFNMDEYVGIPVDHPQSYHAFMNKHFFDHININKDNINIPNGNAAGLEKECQDYEEKIKQYGGIDLFLGGMGADGHIAFNVPGSSLSSRTRVINLNFDTILANSRFFDNDLDQVPKRAITVGVQTVFDAREVVIVVNGYKKARALKKVVEDSISHMWTLSALQMHPDSTIVCDEEATMELKVGTVKYFTENR
ncbi:MAG TPA: glucosamine-6-phosphate deaminase [Mariniphaga sp.]|nr:glucosamine-6-phosphate deaminase [Mariniphaga sp.]